MANRRLLYGLCALVVVLALAIPVSADSPITAFRSIRVKIVALVDGLLDVDGAATFNSTLDVDGATTLNAAVTVGTFGNFTAASVITVTAGCTLTPTGTYQPIAAAGNLGLSDIAADSAGRLLILTNTSNTSIVITDTSTTMLSGNITLTQYDTLTLISDGTNWLEVAHSTN